MKAPIARFDEPYDKSARADYYENVCKKMLTDARFAEHKVRINAALLSIADFRTAILEAMSKRKGKVQARNTAEVKMKNHMDFLLSKIQWAANNDDIHAKELFASLGVTYKKRFPYNKKILKVTHGKISGSFDLMIKRPKGVFAVVWFFTTDPSDENNWKFADFSHTTKGNIDGLVRGTTYYFRARISSSTTHKSDWTNLVDITCF
jgi:hypothetical protein